MEESAALQSRLLSCDKERESPRLKQSYDGKINRGGLASSKVSKKKSCFFKTERTLLKKHLVSSKCSNWCMFG